MPISNLGAGHTAAALAALIFGGLVVGLRKGTSLHRQFGLAYAVSMVAVNVLALTIYRLTGHFGPFHALALVSLCSVAAGVAVAMLRPRHWLALHYRIMSASYLGLLAATFTEIVIRVPALHVANPASGTRVGIASPDISPG